jgi:methyl-accepting chemotaxis protein
VDTVLESLLVRFIGDASSYQQMIQDVQRGTAEASQNIQSLGNDIGNIHNHVQSFGSTAVDFISQVGLTLSGIGLAVGAVRKAASSEDLRTDFEVLLGSAEATENLIGKLAKMSEVTPFRMGTLVESTKQLLGMNMAAEDIVPNLKLLGDISGGSADKLSTFTYVLGRVSSEGSFASYNMRLLRSTGFNPLKELSQATGQSVAYWTEQMHKGNLTMDLFRQAMEHATGEGGRFHDSMARRAQTLSGLFSTLLDAVGKPVKLLGEVIVESLNLKQVERNIIEGTRNLRQFFTDLPPEVKALGATLIQTTGATIALAGGWRILSTLWGGVVGLIVRIDQVAGAMVNGLVAGFQVLNNMSAKTTISLTMLAAELGAVVLVATLFLALGKALGQMAAADEINALNEAVARSTELNQQWAKSFAKGTSDILAEAGRMGGEGGKSFLAEQLKQANKELEGQKRGVKAAKEEYDGYDNAVRRFIGSEKLKMFKDAMDEANKHVAAGRDRVDALKEALKKLEDPAQNPELVKHLTDMTKQMEMSAKTAGMSKEASEFYKKELDRLPPSMTAALWHQIALTRSTEELAAEQKKLQSETHSLQKSLDDEMESIGLTAEQAKLHKLELQGLGGVDKFLVETKMGLVKWLKEENELFKQGAELTKQFRTPIQVYADRLDELQKMLNVGAIKQDTFNRALKDAKKHYDETATGARDAREQVEKLEGVLAGGAEARAHLIEYQTRVLGQFQGADMSQTMPLSVTEGVLGGLPPPSPQVDPVGRPSAAAINDKMVALMSQAVDHLAALVGKPTVEVKGAGLK